MEIGYVFVAIGAIIGFFLEVNIINLLLGLLLVTIS